MALRPYQLEMKSKIYEHWANGKKNVLLVMPTGMGKTRTFCNIAIDAAVEGAMVTVLRDLQALKGGKMPTAIMVHRKELVQQISLTLAEEGIIHNIIAQQGTIRGIVAAQRQLFGRQMYDYNAPVTVISVDTLNARIDKHRKWAESIRFWITDEAAHLLVNNKWGKAVAHFTNPHVIGLGVTATPERLDKKGLGRHADGVFDVMVQGPSTKWGIDNKFLSKYMVVLAEKDYKNYLKSASNGSDFSKEAMTEASEKSQIVGDVIFNYQKHAAGKQAIVFASDVGAGHRMEKKFIEAGIKAKILTGETDDKIRLDTLIAYRKKEIQVLINVDLFDEGLDVPGIEVVILARPTMSLGKYLQMCGRGLRPMDLKEYCIIIDHVGNIFGPTGHGLPDSPRRWTLDRIVRRGKKVNLVRICLNCAAPFERIFTECPYCGHKDEPKVGSGGGRISPAQVDGDLVMLDPDTLRELERKINLESPSSYAQRVSAAGGNGINAMNYQRELHETQKILADAIAVWTGRLTSEGYTVRQVQKQFFIDHEMTIYDALSLPKAEMLKMIERLSNE